VVLEPQHVEATEQHVYVRCPHCRGSFPIRHSDFEAFLGHEGVGRQLTYSFRSPTRRKSLQPEEQARITSFLRASM